jgi:hypothetical protein
MRLQPAFQPAPNQSLRLATGPRGSLAFNLLRVDHPGRIITPRAESFAERFFREFFQGVFSALGERREAQTMFFLQMVLPANGLAASAVNSVTAGKYEKCWFSLLLMPAIHFFLSDERQVNPTRSQNRRFIFPP